MQRDLPKVAKEGNSDNQRQIQAGSEILHLLQRFHGLRRIEMPMLFKQVENKTFLQAKESSFNNCIVCGARQELNITFRNEWSILMHKGFSMSEYYRGRSP
jgi:hypothetical protein